MGTPVTGPTDGGSTLPYSQLPPLSGQGQTGAAHTVRARPKGVRLSSADMQRVMAMGTLADSVRGRSPGDRSAVRLSAENWTPNAELEPGNLSIDPGDSMEEVGEGRSPETVAGYAHVIGTETLGTARPSTHSKKVVRKGLDESLSSAVNLLNAVEKQSRLVLGDDTFGLGEQKDALRQHIEDRLNVILSNCSDPVTKKELKALKEEEIPKLRKEVATFIQKAHVQTLSEMLKRGGNFFGDLAMNSSNPDEMEKFETVASNGGGVGRFRLDRLVRPSYRRAQAQYKAAVEAYNDKVIQGFGTGSTLKVMPRRLDKDTVGEVSSEHTRETALKRRRGVVLLNPTAGTESRQVLIRLDMSQAGILKQISSLQGQTMSTKVRKPIQGDLPQVSGAVKGEARVSTVPLNMHFDEALAGESGGTVPTGGYGEIFGEAGVASSDRQGRHVANAWRNEAKVGDRVVLRFFRHAVLAPNIAHGREASEATEGKKTEAATQQRRQESSREMALELVRAAVLQELADRSGETFDEDHPLELSLSSVSLLTPDLLRRAAKKAADEHTMLHDQIAALEWIQKNLKEIEIDGKQIPVKLDIMTFNFGVNVGAVKKRNLRLGTRIQYEHNIKAFNKLEAQYNEWMKDPMVHPTVKANARVHMDALREMLSTQNGYLKIGNQYAAGARVLCVMQLMGKGNAAAVNCMSGKDRTGFMSAVANTFAYMQEIHGKPPKTEDLLPGGAHREQFRKILVEALMEGGGLDITELNTGNPGYKVTSVAQLYDMCGEVFAEVTGTSKLSGS